MPPEHEALIDKQMLAEYKKRVAEISRANGARYCNLSSSDLNSRANFDDSLHFNERGARKFYAKLIETISNDEDLKRGLREIAD